MYIWVGINIADQLAELNEKAQEIENAIGFSQTALDLPLHISLKISFFVEDSHYAEAMEDIYDFYRTLKPAAVETDKIEKISGFVWLRYKKNSYLADIHERLNRFLQEKYGVPRHMLDNEFIYHTTLFVDGDDKKLQEACARIRNANIPKVIRLDRFLIGTSPDGAWDSYKVNREIVVG